jgi:hypothetical protein
MQLTEIWREDRNLTGPITPLLNQVHYDSCGHLDLEFIPVRSCVGFIRHVGLEVAMIEPEETLLHSSHLWIR